MRKLSFAIIILFLFFSVAGAAPFPPNCICEITGKVISIEEVPIEKNNIHLEIEIISVGPMVKAGISSEMTCGQYKVGQKISLCIVKERDCIDKGIDIKPNMVIKGNIEYTGDERGPGYNFDNIRGISECEKAGGN